MSASDTTTGTTATLDPLRDALLTAAASALTGATACAAYVPPSEAPAALTVWCFDARAANVNDARLGDIEERELALVVAQKVPSEQSADGAAAAFVAAVRGLLRALRPLTLGDYEVTAATATAPYDPAALQAGELRAQISVTCQCGLEYVEGE